MDMQDKYFDEEDEEVEESKSKGTGVYDYWVNTKAIFVQ